MPRTDVAINSAGLNRLIYDELRYNKDSLKEEHDRLMSTLTTEHKGIYDTIMARVDANEQGLFFFYMGTVVQEKLLFGELCHLH